MGDQVEAEVAALARRGIDELRAIWRDRFGDPPPVRSRDLMRRFLAERLQVTVHGEDPDLQRDLARLARSSRPGARPRTSKPVLRGGAILRREWEGRLYVVEATGGAFTYDGEVYRSLSAIARKITGTRWNGPRFFGLREEGEA